MLFQAAKLAVMVQSTLDHFASYQILSLKTSVHVYVWVLHMLSSAESCTCFKSTKALLLMMSYPAAAK